MFGLYIPVALNSSIMFLNDLTLDSGSYALIVPRDVPDILVELLVSFDTASTTTVVSVVTFPAVNLPLLSIVAFP
jgi:hypothetical protein